MLQSLALWNPSFTSAIHSEYENSESPFILFNFSNVDENHYPSTRTCVLRGFLFDQPKTNILIFTTDKRSSKYNDLLLNPRFDACFYFPKMRKQFRFKGSVRMVSDDLIPVIANYNVEDHLGSEMMNNKVASIHTVNDLDENNTNNNDSDTSSVEDENQSLFSQYLSQTNNNDKSCKISEPLHYKLYSQKFIKLFEDSTASLSDLGNRMRAEQTMSKTPTNEEWQNERLRVWNALSRNMKKSFRKPLPGSPLTDENRKLLDAINRGVDGHNSSTGYENFVVVCMFVELVDEVVLNGSGYDRRYLYRKTNHDTWKEYEVCP